MELPRKFGVIKTKEMEKCSGKTCVLLPSSARIYLSLAAKMYGQFPMRVEFPPHAISVDTSGGDKGNLN